MEGTAGATGADGADGAAGEDGATGPDGTDASDADEDGDGVRAAEDCDDTDPTVGQAATLHLDYDGDGYGDPVLTTVTCFATTGWVDNALDCNDLDSAIRPDATEVCNLGIDDDCDGLADDADDSLDLSTATERYADLDADGYGDDAGARVRACALGAGLSDVGGDCDDTDAAVHPEAEEVCDNGIDDNCNHSPDHCLLEPSYTHESDQDVLLTGAGSYDDFGHDLAVGDLNGDGLADLVVGESGYDASSSGAGAVHVFLGAVSVADLGTRDALVEGASANDYLGQDLALADVDNDGYDDIFVGGHGADTAYLFYGSATGINATTSAASADVTVSSTGSVTALGYDVGAAGDIDGDGLPDLLLGDYSASSSSAGAVYVVLGSVSFAASVDLAGGAHGATVQADSSDRGDGLGWRDAAVGADFDGDGLSDVVLGEFSNDDAGSGYGALYAFSGGGLSGSLETTDADTVFVTTSMTGSSYFGRSVAVVDDHDGDGLPDLLAGADNHDGAIASDSGRAFLYRGATSGWGSTVDYSTADTIFDGIVVYDDFGENVNGLADLDGDGRAEVAVGATGWDGLPGTTSDAGGLWVFLGATAGAGGTFTALDADVRFDGASASDTLGDEAVAGDFDGNGTVDLAVGAEAGAAYYGSVGIYFGTGI